MHAALQINPYYGKTSQDGLNAHFDAALAEGPTILYNVPARTGQDIPEAVVHRLANHQNFLGVKECTGNARIQVGLPVLSAHHKLWVAHVMLVLVVHRAYP
jgi:4-hydroxy-tetrahydrodipicolinate synthase